MAGPASSLSRAAGSVVWFILICTRWFKAQFIDPFTDWWVETILGTGEESIKTVIREVFAVITRVLNGFSAWIVSIFVDKSYYLSLRNKLTRKHTWTDWWVDDCHSTFNAIIERDKRPADAPPTANGDDAGGASGSSTSPTSSLARFWGFGQRTSAPPPGSSKHAASNGHSSSGAGAPLGNTRATMKRSASDLFEISAGWAAQDPIKRRGFMEDIELAFELGVTRAFGFVRWLVRTLLLIPSGPYTRRGGTKGGGRRGRGAGPASFSGGQRLPGAAAGGRRPADTSGTIRGRLRRTNSCSTFGPDHGKWTTADVIRHAGYPLEQHKVVTEDGYMLSLERIPRHGARDVVFFIHGIMDTSLGWVSNGVTGSQAFAAYDQGFDVWLGNSRSNPPREHIEPKMKKGGRYWFYTINELAILDLGAQFDFVNARKTAELGASGPRPGVRMAAPAQGAMAGMALASSAAAAAAQRHAHGLRRTLSDSELVEWARAEAAAAREEQLQQQQQRGEGGGQRQQLQPQQVGSATVSAEAPAAIGGGGSSSGGRDRRGGSGGAGYGGADGGGGRGGKGHRRYSVPSGGHRPQQQQQRQLKAQRLAEDGLTAAGLHGDGGQDKVQQQQPYWAQLNSWLLGAQEDAANGATGPAAAAAAAGDIAGTPVTTSSATTSPSSSSSPFGALSASPPFVSPPSTPRHRYSGSMASSVTSGEAGGSASEYSSCGFDSGSEFAAGGTSPFVSDGAFVDLQGDAGARGSGVHGGDGSTWAPSASWRPKPAASEGGGAEGGGGNGGRASAAAERRRQVRFDGGGEEGEDDAGRGGGPFPFLTPDRCAQDGIELPVEEEAAPYTSGTPDLAARLHAGGPRGARYRMRAVGHSLGGAMLLMYTVARRMEGRPHHLSRLVLLTPAGFIRTYPLLALPFLLVLPGLVRLLAMLRPRTGGPAFIPSSLLRYITFKLTVDLQQLPALNQLVVAGIRLVMKDDPSEWDAAMRMPHYNTRGMPALSFHVGAHLCQWVRTRAFRLYDQGSPAANCAAYGSPTPPDIGANYHLLDIPVDLVAGESDGVIGIENILMHYDAMRAAGARVTFKSFKFGHLDFTFAQKDELRQYVVSRLLAKDE